jgi:hypothetical protein
LSLGCLRDVLTHIEGKDILRTSLGEGEGKGKGTPVELILMVLTKGQEIAWAPVTEATGIDYNSGEENP